MSICLHACIWHPSLTLAKQPRYPLRRYHSEQCARSEKQLKADLAWLGKYRGEARQKEYLKDEILTRVVGFGWGEYKVCSSFHFDCRFAHTHTQVSLPPP